MATATPASATCSASSSDAEIFVAVLGASNYTYAEATWTQTLPDWIEAHVRMFRFFGGVPRLVVPDNLKSGVHKASFYDPEINRSDLGIVERGFVHAALEIVGHDETRHAAKEAEHAHVGLDPVR